MGAPTSCKTNQCCNRTNSLKTKQSIMCHWCNAFCIYVSVANTCYQRILTSAYTLAPRAVACCASSSTSTAAPSPITKPSRAASNGLDACSGVSLNHVDRAFSRQNPPSEMASMQASVAPAGAHRYQNKTGAAGQKQAAPSGQLPLAGLQCARWMPHAATTQRAHTIDPTGWVSCPVALSCDTL